MKTMALENLGEMLRKRSKQLCVEVLSLRCGTSAGRREFLCPSLALASCLLVVLGAFGIGIREITIKK